MTSDEDYQHLIRRASIDPEDGLTEQRLIHARHRRDLRLEQSAIQDWHEKLITQLSDSDPEIREQAFEELIVRGEPSINVAKEALSHDYIETRRLGIRILAELGSYDDVEVLGALIGCLDDPEEFVSDTAEEAIRDLYDAFQGYNAGE